MEVVCNCYEILGSGLGFLAIDKGVQHNTPSYGDLHRNYHLYMALQSNLEGGGGNCVVPPMFPPSVHNKCISIWFFPP
jgi:hypothetical protein